MGPPPHILRTPVETHDRFHHLDADCLLEEFRASKRQSAPDINVGRCEGDHKPNAKHRVCVPCLVPEWGGSLVPPPPASKDECKPHEGRQQSQNQVAIKGELKKGRKLSQTTVRGAEVMSKRCEAPDQVTSLGGCKAGPSASLQSTSHQHSRNASRMKFASASTMVPKEGRDRLLDRSRNKKAKGSVEKSKLTAARECEYREAVGLPMASPHGILLSSTEEVFLDGIEELNIMPDSFKRKESRGTQWEWQQESHSEYPEFQQKASSCDGDAQVPTSKAASESEIHLFQSHIEDDPGMNNIDAALPLHLSDDTGMSSIDRALLSLDEFLGQPEADLPELESSLRESHLRLVAEGLFSEPDALNTTQEIDLDAADRELESLQQELASWVACN